MIDVIILVENYVKLFDKAVACRAWNMSFEAGVIYSLVECARYVIRMLEKMALSLGCVGRVAWNVDHSAKFFSKKRRRPQTSRP